MTRPALGLSAVSIVSALLASGLVAGCVGSGGLDELELRASGNLSAMGVAITPADLKLPAGDPNLHLAVALTINGSWAESGGPFCSDDGFVYISDSVILTLNADGSYEAQGYLPLHSGGGSGHAPGCSERTGVAIDSFEEITLSVRLPLKPWNDYDVWMSCQTQAHQTCSGSPDINCPETATRACRNAAWAQTLWHRATGAECVDNGQYFCGADPNFPGGIPSSLELELKIPAEQMPSVNTEFNASGVLVLPADLDAVSL
ncbi:MAG: hypothetical protein IT285_04455 [Bdellovibrionales bacterium]|nr:hypothetical protein [Bdellovibrionales bacterium]